MKNELQLPALARRQSGADPRSLIFLWRELMARQQTLAWFGLALWLAMLPTVVAWGLDDRTLREVNVWTKPLKFMASVGLFSLTTAWFVGLLEPGRRQTRLVRSVVIIVIATGLFEVGYITWQAAWGQASHYNADTLPHQLMYGLMGMGALLLTATQPMLAWQIWRDGRSMAPSVWRDGVVLGLMATFALGASVGGMLGGLQPPAGAGLPVVGWHFSGGDLRPAHFLGVHAQQLIPLAGALLAGAGLRQARLGLWLFVGAYTALWMWAVQIGLAGQTPTPPAFMQLLT